MINANSDKKIKLSYDLPLFINIFMFVVLLSVIIIGIVGLLNRDFSIFNIFSLIFIIVPIYFIYIIVHLANAELDGNFIYLKGILFSKRIALSQIKSVKQKWGLKKNYEPLILLKVLVKTKKSRQITKRFYIMPNNDSYDKKVSSEIYNLLNESILKVKNKITP